MRITAVILAGGRSSRMGRQKALLECGNETLIARTHRILSGIRGIENAVVSGTVDGYKCIPDSNPFHGPVEGISSVAEALMGKTDALLVVPVDMPLLTSDAFQPLLEEYNGEACLYFDDNWLPAVFRLDPFLGRACAATQSMKGLLAQLGGRTIPWTPSNVFANVNTPEDWLSITGRVL